MQIEKPVYGGAFLARDEGKAIFVPLALPGEAGAGARSWKTEPSAATRRRNCWNWSRRRRSAWLLRVRHFGACGGCHYQHADIRFATPFKQPILRETLERGGVKAPDEIAVLAGEPWQYRNRIRLAFDAEGNPGYRGRRSHQIVPIRECPIAAPVLVEAALAAAEHYQAIRRAKQAS